MEKDTGDSLLLGENYGDEDCAEESLEEQVIRREEIQYILTTEMDDFMYDDNTANNSINVTENNSPLKHQSPDEEKYKEASYEDQLKALYEIRTREANNLNIELENMKAQFLQQKERDVKKDILCEAEKERASISLKQSQALTATKTEEISKLQAELQSLKEVQSKLEETIKKEMEEKNVWKHNCNDLRNQLSKLEVHVSSNTVMEKQLDERYQIELTRLHHSLDDALVRLKRSEIEYKDLQQKLHEKSKEKDELLIEKTTVINSLTENLESAQAQCRELLTLLETVSQGNEKLNCGSASPANKSEAIIENLRLELERSNELQRLHYNDLMRLESAYTELSTNLKSALKQKVDYKEKVEELSSDVHHLNEQITKKDQELMEHLENYKLVVKENELMKEKELVFENNLKYITEKQTAEQSIQVSTLYESFPHEYEQEKKILKEELEVALSDVENLKLRLKESESELMTVTTKMVLEEEREILIRNLQEKAEIFEKIIHLKQHNPPVSTQSTNTDFSVDTRPEIVYKEHPETEDLLKTRFEIDSIQREIRVREEMKCQYEMKIEEQQSEFDVKLTALITDKTKQDKYFTSELKYYQAILQHQKEELTKLKEQSGKDRDTFSRLLDDWNCKFLRVEMQNDDLATKYLQVQNLYEKLKNYSKKMEINSLKNLVTLKEKNSQIISNMDKAECEISDVEKKFSKLKTS